jgi:hypothetical protein
MHPFFSPADCFATHSSRRAKLINQLWNILFVLDIIPYELMYSHNTFTEYLSPRHYRCLERGRVQIQGPRCQRSRLSERLRRLCSTSCGTQADPSTGIPERDELRAVCPRDRSYTTDKQRSAAAGRLLRNCSATWRMMCPPGIAYDINRSDRRNNNARNVYSPGNRARQRILS